MRPDNWKRLGFNIKLVFLIAAVEENLEDEIVKFDDILLLDYKENHYGLPAKDYHYLDFIDKKCRNGF